MVPRPTAPRPVVPRLVVPRPFIPRPATPTPAAFGVEFAIAVVGVAELDDEEDEDNGSEPAVNRSEKLAGLRSQCQRT